MKKRRTGESKPQLKALWQAMDEAVFGQERTLNLRESLPSAAAARSRAEVWLRGRQVTRTEEVLIITGRGNQSAGGVGVIREEILGMMPALRRKGIVESWREHSPGSLIVKLAPLSTLLGAGKRRRDASDTRLPPDSGALAGLEAETRELLKQLALRNLDALGIDASEQFIKTEMVKSFSTLLASIPESTGREERLRVAILRAIEEDP
ncbi:MAG: hypothetical protein ACSLFK_11065 [Gemmatimonadaceae bacterium]